MGKDQTFAGVQKGDRMNETELIAAAREGDEDAFQELRRLHLTHVRTVCWAILRTDDLDDVIQLVFVDAWTGLKGFRGGSTSGRGLQVSPGAARGEKVNELFFQSEGKGPRPRSNHIANEEQLARSRRRFSERP